MADTLDEMRRRLDAMSPYERATFRREVFRELVEMPMRVILRDVNRPMSDADWLAMRAWVLGVTGAGRPDFVMEEDADKPGSLERIRQAIRRLMEVLP